MNAFFTSFRRQFGPSRYFWFLEFQRRGAPHFHIGLDIGPIEDADRLVLADCWARIAEPYSFAYCPWKEGCNEQENAGEDTTRNAVYKVHSHPKSWENVRETEGAIRYAAKYATKPYQKTVPENYSDVGRFWAVSKGVKLADGLYLSGTDTEAREIAGLFGRSLDGWGVLPRVIFY